MSWLALLPGALGFTVQSDQADALADAVEQRQRSVLRRLGANFLPNAIAAALGAGMMWGVMTSRVNQTAAQVAGKVDQSALTLILQANSEAHNALMRVNDLEDTRIRELENGRESNRLEIERLKADLAAIKARQQVVFDRLRLGSIP